MEGFKWDSLGFKWKAFESYTKAQFVIDNICAILGNDGFVFPVSDVGSTIKYVAVVSKTPKETIDEDDMYNFMKGWFMENKENDQDAAGEFAAIIFNKKAYTRPSQCPIR